MAPRNDIKAIRPNDVYRALPLSLAIDLRKVCETTGENPAAVIADALMLHLDELAGPTFDPALTDLSQAATGAAQ